MVKTQHWRLIVNGPAADTPGLRDAVQAHRRDSRRVDVRVTWERGDATRFVDEAVAEGVDCVIAAGGDGTVGEVAGAIAAHADSARSLPEMAVLPLGTANDFAMSAGIPAELAAAFELAAGQGVLVDVLCVRAGSRLRWCMNVATGGFGTQATVDVNDGLKKYLGGLSYVLGGVAAIARAEPQEIELRGPGFRWTGPMIALAIGNGRQAGGGQVLCPTARIDDGLIDVTVVRELEGELASTLATAVTQGTRAALEDVAERARLPWIELLSTAPLCLNLDGEPVEATNFHVECLAGRLRMRLPEACPLLGAHSDPAARLADSADRTLGEERL